jgi:N-methylhydantoinase A/oxoprolinase/acetone carboxylase beta subunit
VPVIGLGASAPSYYGAVGERLGCEMILPEHAGVANAIGAVAGQVSQRLTGMVSSPAEGRFVAHLTAGPQVFSDRDVALEAMETALRAEAETRARAAGAVDLRVSGPRAERGRDRGPVDVHRGHGDRDGLGAATGGAWVAALRMGLDLRRPSPYSARQWLGSSVG